MKHLNQAHPMLEPINYDLDPEAASHCLSENQLKVYELLWRAAVATNIEGPVTRTHQLRMPVSDKISLCSKWEELLDPGWTSIIPTPIDQGYWGELPYVSHHDMPSVIPQYNKNYLLPRQQLQSINFKINSGDGVEAQVKVIPEKYLNYASLIDAMVMYKVARPSTYASSLNSVIRNDLLSNQDNMLFVTSYGEKVFEKIENLPEKERLSRKLSYEVETAIEKIEKNSEDAGALLNKFCQQLFNGDTGLAKWLDELEIDGQILKSSDESTVLQPSCDEEEKRELARSEPCSLDAIVDRVQSLSKINWYEHAWDDYTFSSQILYKKFYGRLWARKARRLDTSKEQIFEEHLKDFISIVHIGLCGSIPWIDMLVYAEFEVLTDRTKGFGYLEKLKLVYIKAIDFWDLEEIKKELINGLHSTQFHCLRLEFDVEHFLEVEFE